MPSGSRQQRLTALEARLRAAQAAPEASASKPRLGERRAPPPERPQSACSDKNPDEARTAMLSLSMAARCTAVETSEDRGSRLTAVIGRIFTVEIQCQ